MKYRNNRASQSEMKSFLIYVLEKYGMFYIHWDGVHATNANISHIVQVTTVSDVDKLITELNSTGSFTNNMIELRQFFNIKLKGMHLIRSARTLFKGWLKRDKT